MNVDANQLYFPNSCPSILHNMVIVSRGSSVLSMVVVSILPNAELRRKYHREDAPHFKNQKIETKNFGKLFLETKPKFEVNQTYPICSFSEHAFCAAPVMRNFTNKGCDCYPGPGNRLWHRITRIWRPVNPCQRLSIRPFYRGKYNLRILAIATSNQRSSR